jgi:23S rRNA (uracil1939-C5)-methyltransferase
VIAAPAEDLTGLRVGQTLDVRIEKAVYRGLGLARVDGQVLFVPRAYAGERWRVELLTRERGYLRAHALELLEPAAARRPAPCAHFAECGGCSYQDLDYEAQLELKRAVLHEALMRAGLTPPADVPLHASPEQGWRMRASLHYDARGAGRLGLYAEGSHRVVDLERCLQLSPELDASARAVLGALQRCPDRAGLVSGVQLAEAPDGRTRVVALELAADASQAARLRGLMDALPGLSGLGVVAQAGRSRRYVSLHGSPHIHAHVLGFELHAHVQCFFQANRFLLEPLVERVRAWAGGPGPLLDLYAGVGLFALPLAATGARVRAAELHPQAVEDGRANARRAGLDIDLFQGDVRAALAVWSTEAGERVVLDPPRAGAGPEVVSAVAARRPADIVYVSCDPATLARDLRAFAGHGYVLDGLEAFDMFPDTFHLEAVARLRPA